VFSITFRFHDFFTMKTSFFQPRDNVTESQQIFEDWSHVYFFSSGY